MAGNEHTCMANEHKLVIGSCRGSKAKKLTNVKKKKNQHLHDDGFLGHFSLLFSDYKENSMNSMGLKKAKAEMIKLSLLSSSTSTGMKNNQLYHPIHAFCGYFQHNL